MKVKDCKRYESCNAPLCPKDQGSLERGSWFPFEEICGLQTYCHESWIRNQKKIAKKSRNIDFYFTHRMLEQNCIIGRGIVGIDPDHDITDIKKDETRWLQEHPVKRIISEEKRELLRNRMEKIRQGLNPSEKDANGIENLIID